MKKKKESNKIKRNETHKIFSSYYEIENIVVENCLNLWSCYVCPYLNRLGERAVNVLLERS